MAEAKFSRTFRGGSEECFDYICTPCEDSDKIVEAQHYCPKCAQFYCDACLKTHQKFPALREHKVFGRADKSDWGTRRAEDECPTHRGQVISMHCGKHDVLCCPVCASMDHRPSCDMGYLPEKGKGIVDSKEYIAVQENISKVHSEVLKLKEGRENLRANLQRSRQSAAEDMADFKKRVTTALDKLEAKFLSELDDKHVSYNAEIQSDLNTTDAMLDELDRLKADLDNKESANESLLFIRMKQCQKKVAQKTNEIKALSRMKRVCEINFSPNLSLSDFIGSVESFGKLVHQNYRPNHKYTVDKSVLCNVRAKEDKLKCDITGICQLSDGTLVLADHSNDSLKQLGRSYQIVDRCQLSLKPTALCIVAPNEVALTTTSKTIIFVSLENRMSVTRLIPLEHETYGIGFSNDKLYVTNMFSKMYVYSLCGAFLQTISSDESGDTLLSNSRNMTVGMNGAKLHITDKNKGLITFDNQGNKLSNVKDMKGAWGVCTDPSGNVFVATSDNGTIVQVSESGEKVLGVLANKSKGMERPWCVFYDKTQDKLLVSKNPVTQGCDYICVLKLK